MSRRPYTLLGSALALIAGLLAAPSAQAATSIYCVTTGIELLAALNDAEYGPEGSTQDIRVHTGSYSLSNPLKFIPPGDKDNKVFSLTGGWGDGCVTRTTNPANTQIAFTSSNADNRQINLYGDNARYTVEGIRFKDFSFWSVNDKDCSFDTCPDTESITVRYNEFRDGDYVVLFAGDARTVSVRNNLFDGMYGGGQYALVTLRYDNNETAPDVSFNTFANMSCPSSGLSIFSIYTEAAGVVLHHNVFQGTGCGADIDVLEKVKSCFCSGNPIALRNNLYKSLKGLAPTSQSGNLINTSPQFVDAANDNYNLRTSAPVSPAIDAGLTLPELVIAGLIVQSQDLDGGTRLVGARYDMGAFESPGPPPTEFVVTNTNDAGAGSLRAAIDGANAAAGFQKIRFNISGACPRKIALATELPDITDDVEIDGYTQPGSEKNTAQVGNTGIVCVTVGPASGTLQYALRVPDAVSSGTQLTVRGLGFFSAYGVALNIRGGSGHIVQGNAFGGVRPGSFDSLGSSGLSHLGLRGAAQGALIGGPDPEDRNWFGGTQLNAILLIDATSGGHTVRNNYIGLDPGGAVPQDIGGNGISAQNSPSIQIRDNVIAGADSGIRIAGATATGYQVKGNTIGLDAFGGQGASASNNNGILVTSGSGGHLIGSLSGTARSNVISNNNEAGVWIEGTAGTGTVVRPNGIYGNGKSGTGLGVDLGPLGPAGNDALDPDGGANAGQNSPVITGETKNADGTFQVKGGLESVPGKTYRIDLYRSPNCPGGNRGGDAKTRVLTFDAITGAAGLATFSVPITGTGVGVFLTAIATEVATGNTSEIGACFGENLFEDSFE